MFLNLVLFCSCPAKAGTCVLEDGRMELMYLYDLDTHICGQDRVEVIRQNFKNEVKKMMSKDPRAKFGRVKWHLYLVRFDQLLS